jgi:DMSO/TMAO reductase YedYZ molybdopterin-dependent catalytic subunit
MTISRRTFLGATVLGIAGCNSGDPQFGFLGLMERCNEKVEGVLYHASSTGPSRKNLTPEAAFPVYKISRQIPIAPEGWRLQVGGLVARPGSFSLDDLTSMTRIDRRIEHHCVEGWSAVADWHGVRLSDLAERVGADPRAGYVQFLSFDGNYSSSWDRASAMHPDTMIAYGMNGRPLGPDHGAPVRVYSSVKLGYKNVKYLTEVNFLDKNSGGYWEDQGYEWYGGV